jgi:hypothetical protein
MDIIETNETTKVYKSFTFVALVQTAIRAQGYLHGSGYIVSDGKLVVGIGSRYFSSTKMSEILSMIADSFSLKFLEENVEHTCIYNTKSVSCISKL